VITTEERQEILSVVHRHQQDGTVFGWSLDEEQRRVQFFVPENIDLSGLPLRIGAVDVVLIPIPRPEELLK
jgi:hypothetical protein